MKNVLVTGANGFIGREVCKTLNKHGINVFAVVRKNAKKTEIVEKYAKQIIECNLSEMNELPSKIDLFQIDTIYHLAWQGVYGTDAKDDTIQLANIMATLSLIDIAHDFNISTFIGAGSIHENEVLTEMSQHTISSNLGIMYKTAKLAAHYMGKAKADSYGIHFFWPRITNAYGSGEDSTRFINTVVKQILSGEHPKTSLGEQLYDFIHVSDAAEAFYLIGDYGKNGTNYVIGSGKPKILSKYLKDLEKIVNQYTEEYCQIDIGGYQGKVVFLNYEDFSTETLCKDTGFETSITFAEGIDVMAKWMKKKLFDDM